jgi:hypothetical protein
MANETKDYFVDSGTTNQIVLDARARYVYLINKYSNLASNQFMKDGEGLPYSVVDSDKSINPSTSGSHSYLLFVFFGGLIIAGAYSIIRKQIIVK